MKTHSAKLCSVIVNKATEKWKMVQILLVKQKKIFYFLFFTETALGSQQTPSGIESQQ